MKAKILIGVVALSLTGVGTADAYYVKKRHKHHRGPVVTYVAPAQVSPGPRPAWAPPGSCFTDEGYGRYRPCDASPSIGGGR